MAIVTLIVVVDWAVRFAVAQRHTSPRLFPDEYIYAEIARSIADGRGTTIRGGSAHFPALLEPILAAPFWLLDDSTVAYRLTQGLHAVAMSLAAVPVYWLARRLGVATWYALACSVFTVALPSFVYSSYITADAVAYPLALTAVAGGVAVLDTPSRRNQLVFVSAVMLATFARVQYAAVAMAFVIAALALGRGRVPAIARRYMLTWVLLGVPAFAVFARGPGRVLGYYDGVLALDVSPSSIVHRVGVDAMLLALAAGAVIVPGAVAGIVAGLRRRATSEQRSFSLLVTAFVSLLLFEAALYATNGSPRFHERYLIAITPLLPVAFCVGAKALPRERWIVVTIATALALLSMTVPLAGYAALDGKQDSPFLQSFDQLQLALGIGTAGLAVAAATGLLATLAAAAAFRPRYGSAVVLCVAIVAVATVSVGITAADRAGAARMERTFAAGQSWTWVDDEDLGSGSILVTPGADRRAVGVDLFWNRDLGRLLRLPDGPYVDAFGDEPARIARNGTLLAAGRPVRGPLLVEESFAKVVLDHARVIRSTVSATLWAPRPKGDVRVAMMTVGRYIDDWIDPRTRITVWPNGPAPRTGTVTFRFSLPARLPKASIRVHAPGFARLVDVTPGASTALAVPVRAGAGPVVIELRGETAMRDGDRLVTVQMKPPKLLERGR